MTQLVAKYAMKKVMAKEMDKYKSKDVSGPYVSLTLPTHPSFPPPLLPQKYLLCTSTSRTFSSTFT